MTLDHWPTTVKSYGECDGSDSIWALEIVPGKGSMISWSNSIPQVSVVSVLCFVSVSSGRTISEQHSGWS